MVKNFGNDGWIVVTGKGFSLVSSVDINVEISSTVKGRLGETISRVIVENIGDVVVGGIEEKAISTIPEVEEYISLVVKNGKVWVPVVSDRWVKKDGMEVSVFPVKEIGGNSGGEGDGGKGCDWYSSKICGGVVIIKGGCDGGSGSCGDCDWYSSKVGGNVVNREGGEGGGEEEGGWGSSGWYISCIGKFLVNDGVNEKGGGEGDWKYSGDLYSWKLCWKLCEIAKFGSYVKVLWPGELGDGG